ncbi:unnamed protein product [Gadus morhua 'NCC']
MEMRVPSDPDPSPTARLLDPPQGDVGGPPFTASPRDGGERIAGSSVALREAHSRGPSRLGNCGGYGVQEENS